MKKVQWKRATVLQKKPTTSIAQPPHTQTANPARIAGVWTRLSSQTSSGYRVRSRTVP